MRVQREVGDARGLDLAGRRAPRRDESPARYAIDARRTFYKEAGLQRKGTGKARRHSWGWW